MIYVSSSCVRFNTIAESVEFLAREGFKNIELSGGTRPYPGLSNDLMHMRDKYGLKLLCHNYFPPPEKDFVLNLASLDDEINALGMEHIRNALRLSEQLGATKFAFHAGFMIDIPLAQIGREITQRSLFDRERALARFCENYLAISNEFPDTDIYVENNVLSKKNFENYNGTNPLFLTDLAGMEPFKHLPRFRPLIDVAHLKVSANSLGLNFVNELEGFMSQTDYVHISDNDGLADTNGPLRRDSQVYEVLKHFDWKERTITLEVYSGLDDLKSSFELINELVH